MAVAPMGSAPANTYVETTAVGVKEDLADIIYRIDPDETPLLSALPRVGSKQVMTEWIVQELNPATDNAQPEGFTAVMQAVLKPVRLNNICQILARTVGVSNTLRVVDVAGGEDEFNRQLILRGMEIKRDLELAITSPLVRTITDPRHMSGLPTYISLGKRGAGAGVMPVGDGSNAGTVGTAWDLTLNDVQLAMQAAWQAGGKPTLGLMSGAIKLYFATLSQGGTNNAIAAQNIVQVTRRGKRSRSKVRSTCSAPTSARSICRRIASCRRTWCCSSPPTTPRWRRSPSATWCTRPTRRPAITRRAAWFTKGAFASPRPKRTRCWLTSINSGAMSTPLYSHYDPVTTRFTEIVEDPETGLPVFTKTQNTKPIIESAKALAANFAGTPKHGITHVARIPTVIWQRLVMTGVARDEKALNAWLNDPDNQVFRCDDGRRL